MKKIKNYSSKLLAFEVARLRTLYKNNPDIRDRIVKRYRLIVDEYSSRGLRWFWSDHVLDKLIKADWCVDQGGSWITVKGKHICVGKDIEFSRNEDDWLGSAIIHGENKTTFVKWKKGCISDEQVLEIKGSIQYYPKNVRESINGVEITEGFLDGGVTGVHHPVGKMGRKSNIYLSNKEDLVGTLHHEIGHNVYNNYVKVVDARETRWSEIHKAKASVSWYGTTSSEEDFAESLRLYKTDKKALVNEYPDRHEFIENILEGVEDES